MIGDGLVKVIDMLGMHITGLEAQLLAKDDEISKLRSIIEQHNIQKEGDRNDLQS